MSRSNGSLHIMILTYNKNKSVLCTQQSVMIASMLIQLLFFVWLLLFKLILITEVRQKLINTKHVKSISFYLVIVHKITIVLLN